MKHKTETYVNERRNIVVRTEVEYSPEEFLMLNKEVWNFSQEMTSHPSAITVEIPKLKHG